MLYKFSAPTTIVKTATVASGTATFDLTGVNNGDYFIILNDSTTHRSPIYLADYTKNYTHKVGANVRLSVMLSSTGDSLYKFKTHNNSDGELEVLKYSNSQGTGRYSYSFVSYSTKTLEIRYIDDGSVISSLPQSNNSYHYSVFGSWDLGKTNHGKGPESDSLLTSTMCGDVNCHPNFWVKPPQWSQITQKYGWCNKCHDGYLGACDHFYDKNQ